LQQYVLTNREVQIAGVVKPAAAATAVTQNVQLLFSLLLKNYTRWWLHGIYF
jgi:hypothetical protein